MATTTTRGGLIKPGDGESADIVIINANMDKISLNAMGAFICTSTTRPGAPYQGQQIFETDTKASGTWNGVKWSMTDSIWQSYVPVWRSTGVAPTLGASTIRGRYLRNRDGITFSIDLVIGAGSAGGTGNYYFDIPFTNQNTSGVRVAVAGWLYTASTPTFSAMTGCIDEGANMVQQIVMSSNALFGSSQALGNGAAMTLSGSYVTIA